MKKIKIHEYKHSVDKTIELSHTYEVGSVVVGDNLIVYPQSDTVIKLSDDCDDGLYAITYNHICSDDTQVISSIPNAKSLYKSYSTENILNENNKYTVNLVLDDKDYSKEFYSKLNPLFSTVDKIRNDTGNFLSDIDDITIYKFIYQNSLDVLEMVESDEDSTSSSDEEVTITRTMKEYVRYKTDLDLINSVYLNLVKKYGKVKKTIASLDIEYDSELPDIEDLLDYFKDKVKNYEDQLINSSTGLVSTFVKANNTSYPIDARNSF